MQNLALFLSYVVLFLDSIYESILWLYYNPFAEIQQTYFGVLSTIYANGIAFSETKGNFIL